MFQKQYDKAFCFAFLTTIASVLGGMFGYSIDFLLLTA